MNRLDFQEMQQRVNILNVAYHLCLEIIEQRGYEYKAICPFCGYNKLSKIPTLSLNLENNKYCCSECGAGGYSVGLYAKMKKLSNDKAFKELLERECFSQDRTLLEIRPMNQLADIETRDKIYRDFLSMLRLEVQHKRCLRNMGFLDSTIEDNLYKSVPKNYIKRRMIANNLSKKYKLEGLPGFYQEEDFKWIFSKYNGFFVPVFDANGYIQGLSIHLDKPFNNNQDIWFSSNNKINGTRAKNWIMKSNINEYSTSVILTDSLLLGALAKDITGKSVIAFQNITNSYMILKEIENTQIKDIIFLVRRNNNLDYIINRVFRDLIPLGYNLDSKYISNYKDFFNDNFNVSNTLNKVA